MQEKEIKKLVGLRQSLKAIDAGQVTTVFIADDADKSIKDSLEDACRKNQITIKHVETMQQLGKDNGIQIGTAVVCLLR